MHNKDLTRESHQHKTYILLTQLYMQNSIILQIYIHIIYINTYKYLWYSGITMIQLWAFAWTV